MRVEPLLGCQCIGLWLSEALAQVLQEPNERRASLVHNCRLSLLGCEFISVAFCSAKVCVVNATFAEQKATLFCTLRIKSQPL